MKPSDVKSSHWLKFNLFFFLEHILGYSRFQKTLGQYRKELYAEIDRYFKNSGRGAGSHELLNINKDISFSDFKKLCYEPVMPRVFRKAALEWPAIKKWNLEFFEDKYGDKKIVLNDNVGLNPQEYDDSMNLKQYINQLREGSLKYLKFSRIVHDDDNLKNDLNLAWLRQFHLPGSFREEFQMFMGGQGTLTPLHVGFSCNLFVQVMGRKKWILYPAGDRIFLDPRAERTFYYYSKANPYNLDDPNFPLLKYARKYEIILEPGDVLWNPPFTWHHVENLTHSIGIGYRFNSVLAAFKSSKVLASLIFMATKPNIFHHFYVSLTQKQPYLFAKKQAEIERSEIKSVLERVFPAYRKASQHS